MRIGFNARYLQNTHSGIETYILNLLLNLKKIDKINEYLLFFGRNKPVPDIISEIDFDCDISSMHTGNQLKKALWEHLYLPNAIKRKGIDIFHEPFFVAPVFKKCPTIITIYDLAFLRVPDAYNLRNKLYFKLFLEKSIISSDAIIAISNSTKEDIISVFPQSKNKVFVVYPGRDEDFRKVDDKERLNKVKDVYNIRGEFLLSVSLLSPRKNIINLIRAFKIFRSRSRLNEKLVIVGRKGWLWKDIFKEVSSSGLDDDIIFCGHIPKDHLIALYGASKAFIYPSFYEGFGLPIIEAMSCAVPVIASKSSSMPEACGDAAILVDPYNAGDLADAMENLCSDPSLQDALIKKGLRQVEKFSWVDTAEKTLKLYNDIYNM